MYVSEVSNGVYTNGHSSNMTASFTLSKAANMSEPFGTHARIADIRSKTATRTTAAASKSSTSTTGNVVIDGQTLSVGDVIAVARNGAKASISPSVHARVEASVAFKESKKQYSVYGVTTGFGGSANTRTADTEALQVSLLEHQLCGFLPSDAAYEKMLLHAMPIPIVKGAMAIRVNSCVRGHSGVRLNVLQAIIDFLNIGLVPCVPLRGTISASGDLSPLSYIAGSVCGHPDIKVFDTLASPPTVLSAPDAIAKYGLPTIRLLAKEGLGLVNGTAVSASAGAQALYDAECLAVMSQSVTAMTVEALIGQVGSFHPFIHDEIRPHPGQIDAAKTIRTLLEGSKLAIHEEGEIAIQEDVGVLRQDRYALRTSAQWIGPQLEALALARKQIEIELNSTTDNPLIDVKNNAWHHGGNFQAMAVTSAMDSARIVLQNLGKLSFSQVSELINCDMNRGLPSCLAGSEPSTNYHCKGLDIHSAAYCSELGFLANPVSSHVQSTEMHNQSVNSLAFISARKTMEACEVLSLLLSTHLYCATQAVDLRMLDANFQAEVRTLLEGLLEKHFSAHLPADKLANMQKMTFIALIKRLEHTSSMDSTPRFEDAARTLVGLIVDYLMSSSTTSEEHALATLGSFRAQFANSAASLYVRMRDQITSGQANYTQAKDQLGRTYAVYEAVRHDLDIQVRKGDVADGRSGSSIGSSVSKIVEAMRDGRLITAVGNALAA